MDDATQLINVNSGDSSGANDWVVVLRIGFGVNEKDMTVIDW